MRDLYYLILEIITFEMSCLYLDISILLGKIDRWFWNKSDALKEISDRFAKETEHLLENSDENKNNSNAQS